MRVLDNIVVHSTALNVLIIFTPILQTIISA